MKLQPLPYRQIASGTKTLEIRLNDEKRKRLKVGDYIELALLPDCKESICVEVLELHLFPTFKDCYAAFPPIEYGATHKDEYECMYHYYTQEEEGELGVVGIRVRLREDGAL